jgi:peptidoglycan/LPS O-acetylase OafA/YrhL
MMSRRFRASLFFRIFSILTLLLVIPAAAINHDAQSLLLVVFGSLVVAVAFGFGFGQRNERRASGSQRKQWLDSLVVSGLAATAIGLALTDHAGNDSRFWFAVAVLTLLLESFYRLAAEHLRQDDELEGDR